MPKRRKPWILYLPKGFAANPLGMGLSVFTAAAGLIFATGLAKSAHMNDFGLAHIYLQLWGGLLTVASGFIVTGILKFDLPMERFGCRLMTIALLIYAAWIFLAVGIHSLASVAFCLILAFFCELRSGTIKQLLSPWTPPPNVRAE